MQTKASPPEITEKAWASQVKQLAKTFGWTVYSTFLSKWSIKGYPDLTMVHPGQRRVIFAELKRENGKTTPAQDEWLQLLRDAGQEVFIWRPSQFEEAARVLQGKVDKR